MKLETFFEKFDLIADAPNAVAKMRIIIFTLAVQGKLVLQNPSEGNVNVSPKLIDSEPYRIPSQWSWVFLGELALFINGDRSKNYPSKNFRVNTGIPFINAGHLSRGDVTLDDMDYITEDHFNKLGSGKVERGDVLYCLRGSLGKSAVVSSIEIGAIASSLLILRPKLDVSSRYLYYYLCSSLGHEMIAHFDNGSAQPNLSANNVKKYLLPLPPLAEQMRIVAKVDELMALCDRLEAEQKEREEKKAALTRASLARFTKAPTPANLNYLFHKSYNIAPADLRKTILTLAIQGKLVPQDPNDEPAEDSLYRCGVDVKRWTIMDVGECRDVPNSWTWIRFAGVGKHRLGKMLDVQKNRGFLKPYLRNTNVQWLRFDLDDLKEMRIEEREEEELKLKHGDLLICEGGEPGRCAIWREEAPEMYFQKALHRVRPCDAILSEFLSLNLQIDSQNGLLANYFTGATIKHLTGRSLSEYAISIPPLAEQRRIVTKVDELMTLVDDLEKDLAASRATASDLLDAIVAELIADKK